VADLAAELGSRVANRMFGGEHWAREALARHANRTFRISVGPLASQFAIAPDGELMAAAGAGAVPDLEIVVSPLRVPALLADPSRWPQHVVTTGDAALAATLQELAQTLPWFVERAFASVLGPITGQRVADAGRALLAFPAYASERIAESIGSYARDEANLLAPGTELQTFGEQVAMVATRVDALAERIERITAAIAARSPDLDAPLPKRAPRDFR
jgi:ubiquinone biosynthesis protein UbiJ